MTELPAGVACAEDAAAELATLRDMLRWATSRIAGAALAFGQGTASAQEDARALALWSLNLPVDDFEDWLDCRLTASERRAIVQLVERRCIERVPVAYLTGEAWLGGVCFKSDARALIPRSLIAEALMSSFADWLEHHPRPSADWPHTVLDLCTGGGSLAILAALAFPGAAISAVDLSQPALELAAENLALHGLAPSIRLLHGDLYSPVAGEKFELILCNPPYVNDFSMGSLPDEFLAEPRDALAGGADGMDLIRTILSEAAGHLCPGGLLILEIGHEAEHFEQAFPTLEHHWLPVTAGEHMVALIERDALVRAFGSTR